MAHAYFSGIVETPPDTAWKIVRQFDGLPNWHPLVDRAVIEERESPQEVGAVRRQDLADGSQVAEKLLAIDELRRSYTYEFTDPGNIPVTRYRSTLRVTPITEIGHSLVEWYSTFDCASEDEEGLIKMLSDGVYASGISSLREYLRTLSD